MKKYINPKMQINIFDTENIVTKSSAMVDGVNLTQNTLKEMNIKVTEAVELFEFSAE